MGRLHNALWIVAAAGWLVAGAAGCSFGLPSIGNQGGECQSGTSCTCNNIGNCDYTCPDGNCDFVCDGLGNCDMSCAGGNCTIECRLDSGNCIVDCSGENCNMTACTGTGTCDLKNCNGTCTQMCNNTGICRMD